MINRQVPRTTAGTTMVLGGKLPRWLKITRVGNVIAFYTSTNGATFNRVARSTVTMSAEVLVGIAVSSRVPTNAMSTTWTNVSVTGTAPAAPSSSTLHAIDLVDGFEDSVAGELAG